MDNPPEQVASTTMLHVVKRISRTGSKYYEEFARRSSPSVVRRRWHCDENPTPNAATVKLVYVDTKSGRRTEVQCLEGENLLHVAHKNNVDLEGACECSLACSTCHVMLSPDVYDRLDEPSDAEQDMLDLAYGLTST